MTPKKKALIIFSVVFFSCFCKSKYREYESSIDVVKYHIILMYLFYSLPVDL